MNVETGPEAAQFPGKEYIIGIAVAVHAFYADSKPRPEIQAFSPFIYCTGYKDWLDRLI